MKKSKIFFDIVFRCDGGDIPKLGYGHLYRCLVLANFYKKKFSLSPKKIVFIIKSKNKYSKGLKILKKYNFSILKIREDIKDYGVKEVQYFKKVEGNLLIIDRLGDVTKNFFNGISDRFRKKVILDDSSNNRKLFDLSLNPLIQNVLRDKNSKIGYEYLILNPLTNLKKAVNENNIFLFFGGFDAQNITPKIIKVMNQINRNFKLFLPLSFKGKKFEKISDNKIFYYKSNQYYNRLVNSNIAITSGGIGLFDAILNKKKIICVPQYAHQTKNAKKVAKKKAIYLLNLNDKNFDTKFLNYFFIMLNNNEYKKKIHNRQNKIINYKMLNKTFNLFAKLYNESKYK